MSLQNYIKKGKPANWVTAFPGQVRKVSAKPVVKARQKPVRRRSTARIKADRAYNKRVKVWLMEPGNGSCRACELRNPKQDVECHFSVDGPAIRGESVVVNFSNQCHHQFGRGHHGELLMVEKFWIPVCSDCHDWIHHREPAKARELGLLAPLGQYNNPPKDAK